MDYSENEQRSGIDVTAALGDLLQPLNQVVESTSPAALDSFSLRLMPNFVGTGIREAANPPMVPTVVNIHT